MWGTRFWWYIWNVVAKFCLRFPSLLNFMEFLCFHDILSILVLQASLYRQSRDNSGIPGLCLLWQVFLYRHPVKQPFAILENSTLRRDWNFVLILRQVSLNIHSVDLRLWVSQAIRRNRTVDRWTTCRDSDGQVHRRWLWFCHNPVIFFLFLHPLRRRVGAADQAEILSWNGWSLTNEEVWSTHNVCNSLLSICLQADVWCRCTWFELNLRIQNNSVKRPLKTNSVGSWHLSVSLLDSCLWLSS